MRENRTRSEASTTLAAPRPTPRQRQILELASIGLSDDEIAVHLKVSSRTVRFQLEKIFRMLGARGRAEAVVAWMNLTDQSRRPVDECPYPKPFADHFAQCPAYEARQAVTLDERSQPVGRIWTCHHLQSRLRTNAAHAWYGACNLGGAGDRERWAAKAGPDRLHTLNQLMHQLAPVTGPFVQRLWQLKGEQARALEREQDAGSATKSMETLAGRFVGYIETYLNWHRDQLEQNQLAIDECVDQARRLIDRVLAQGSPELWDDRFDALMSFPADVWTVEPSNPRRSAIHSRT